MINKSNVVNVKIPNVIIEILMYLDTTWRFLLFSSISSLLAEIAMFQSLEQNDHLVMPTFKRNGEFKTLKIATRKCPHSEKYEKIYS